jgi:fructokinase
VVCLGEPLVDLICRRPVAGVADGDAFVPHFGGVVANVAVVARRAGARVALAGGAGDDDWGRWLRARLEAEGVELDRFRLLPGRRTALAVVSVDEAGEPSYSLYGSGEPVGVTEAIPAAGPDVLSGAAGLFIGSNTLVGEPDRELTMALRAAALERELPVVFDPNLRLHRWRSRADAAASANACVPGALLVRCTEAEAALMTGERETERAALALVKAGARLVVVSRGRGGAILRGELRADAPGARVQVTSTLGAGDVLTGMLLGRLAVTGWYLAAAAAALPEAVAAATVACERWGALD